MYEALLYLALTLGVVPLCVYYSRRVTKESKTARAILPFLFLTAFSSFYEYFFTLLLGRDVAVYFEFYVLFEFVALLVFFFKVLPNTKGVKVLLSFFTLAFIIQFVVYNYLGNKGDQLAITGILNCTTFGMVVFSVLFYFSRRLGQLQNDLPYTKWGEPLIFAGLLLYFTGTFLVFLMADDVLHHNATDFYDYWLFNIAATAVFRLLLILGIWKV